MKPFRQVEGQPICFFGSADCAA